jgi:ATP citrate (pro-S)-lyase
MITFASLRSVYETVMEALQFKQLKVIAIIAEGVPENQTRKIIKVQFFLIA